MPRLIRLYIQQCLVGFGLSAVFVGALLWADVANLRHLITGSSVGVMAGGLLWLFNGLVFAGVQFGITVMRMAEDDTPPSGGRRVRALQPIRVTVPASGARRDVLSPRRRG